MKPAEAIQFEAKRGRTRTLVAVFVILLGPVLPQEFVGDYVRQAPAQGFDAGGTTPEQFADIIRQDMARWQRVIAKANIRAE